MKDIDGFMRYTELADAVEKWLKETGQRTHWLALR
jgi:hypothetical protein